MKKGFTLIELLGVVALMGIVVLIAMPNLLKSNDNEKKQQYDSFKQTMKEACETYKQVEKKNPTPNDLIDNGYIQKSLVNPKTKAKVLNESGSFDTNCNYSK